MIGVSAKPSASSWARSAPTRPSIMSLGATTSAPGRGVGDRGAHEQLERGVVVDVAVLAHDAAVAVARVLAQAHVGHDEQVGVGLLDRADRELDDALVVVGARALLVLVVGDAEQQHGRDAEGGGGARLLDGVGDREALDAGHRGDGLAAVGAVDDEQRVDEIARLERGLAHEVAQDAGLAQPAQARLGKGHRPEDTPRSASGRARWAYGGRVPDTAAAPVPGGGARRRARRARALPRAARAPARAADRRVRRGRSPADRDAGPRHRARGAARDRLLLGRRRGGCRLRRGGRGGGPLLGRLVDRAGIPRTHLPLALAFLATTVALAAAAGAAPRPRSWSRSPPRSGSRSRRSRAACAPCGARWPGPPASPAPPSRSRRWWASSSS